MMAADQDLDRSEAATPYKLQKAREKGQVAKSPDIAAAVILGVALAWLVAQGWDGLRALFRLDRMLLTRIDAASPAALAEHALSTGLAMLAPFLAFVVIAAILANLAQTGPVFTFKPLAPDATRLSPANGFRRLLSLRSVFDLGKSIVKLAALGLVTWFMLRASMPQVGSIATLSALGQAHTLVDELTHLGTKLLVVIAVVAAVDLVFVRRQYAARMRMSRHELKEEVRHREGDPRIRARLRELRRAMLKRAASIRRTKDADVVITNPTHYAIALKYEHGRMAAPLLIGKGAGATAASMRQIAARHGVPVVQSPRLARALFAGIEIDRFVTPEHYTAVARIMVWVLARRGEVVGSRVGAERAEASAA